MEIEFDFEAESDDDAVDKATWLLEEFFGLEI